MDVLWGCHGVTFTALSNHTSNPSGAVDKARGQRTSLRHLAERWHGEVLYQHIYGNIREVRAVNNRHGALATA